MFCDCFLTILNRINLTCDGSSVARFDVGPTDIERVSHKSKKDDSRDENGVRWHFQQKATKEFDRIFAGKFLTVRSWSETNDGGIYV